MLTFFDGEVHRPVGERPEAAVGDEADVHAGVAGRRLLDDQLVEVLVVAGRDVFVGVEDEVALLADAQRIVQAEKKKRVRLRVGSGRGGRGSPGVPDVLPLESLEPLDVGRGRGLDPALEGGLLADEDAGVGGTGVGDDRVGRPQGLPNFQGVVLGRLAHLKKRAETREASASPSKRKARSLSLTQFLALQV